MKLHVHVHHHSDPTIGALCQSIHHQVGLIMTKVSELEGRLDAIQTTMSKISGETSALVQQVADLKAQLQDVDLPAGAEAKLAEIEATARRIDDAVPDATPPSEGDGGTSVG